ncbi:hypothetical protein [Marinifilum fragile]|uniref:hypothetical protein n=1 Tax=Marinifilum fragile TaxID=570161 RepID=UPI002AA8A488|nr:hypothetical protein [Marinifilum fragile]
MKKTFILLLCFIAFATACQDDHQTDENPMVESYVRDNFFNPNFISSRNEYIGNASKLKSSYSIAISDMDIEFRDQIMKYYHEKLNFAQQINNKVGLPVWDYTIYNTYDVEKVAFIPCARENSNYTEGVIIVLQEPSTNRLFFNYVDRYNFDGYLDPRIVIDCENIPDKSYIMSLFLIFDNRLFNYADCDLLADFQNLLSTNTETSTKASSPEQDCRIIEVLTEQDHYVDTYVGGERQTHNFSHVSKEISLRWICRDINESKIELPWGSTTGGGGTGGVSPNPLPKIDNESKYKDVDKALAYLKQRGALELALMFEELAFDPNLSREDRIKLYDAILDAYQQLQGQYLMSIFSPETVGTVLSFALIPNITKTTQNRIFQLASTSKNKVFQRMAIGLRDALKGEGNFGLGKATRQEAIEMGKAWVGKDYQVKSIGDQIIWKSKDGMRQFRMGYKGKLGKTQANFQRTNGTTKSFEHNGHLDITN